MSIQGNDIGLAYIRRLDHINQCELQFLIHTTIPRVGTINEEIKLLVQQSTTVSFLLRQIEKKLRENVVLKDNRSYNIPISLKKKNNDNYKGNKKLKDFIMHLVHKINTPFTLKVLDQKYTIIINPAFVKELKLPPLLYVNNTIQPLKFRVTSATNYSKFYWYKSLEKTIWEHISEGFTCSLVEKDVGHYIKLVCVPFDKEKVNGPCFEVISDNVVEATEELPTCPFEKRHEYTRDKLRGLAFRVVSYNILAERYTSRGDNYAYCSPKVLAIDYRKRLIVKELTGYNADIICLQEVDCSIYGKHFKIEINKLGYGSVYHKKGGNLTEGLACFFRKSRLELLKSQHIVFRKAIKTNRTFTYLWRILDKNGMVLRDFVKQHTSLQVMVFQVKGYHNKYLMVANTHLYYHPEATHIRLLQANMATAYLNMLTRPFLREDKDVSVIFCGDFNSDYCKSIYRYMVEGELSPQHEDCLRVQHEGKMWLHHEFEFKSACGTPKYTNYTPEYKGCLDYIFFESDKMKVARVIPLPDEEELRKHEGLPNHLFPSDHLALVVELKLT